MTHKDKCSRDAAVLRNLRRLVRERIVRRGLRRPRHRIRRPFRLSDLRNAIRRKFVTSMVIAVGSKSVGEIIGLPANQLELRRDGEAAESLDPCPKTVPPPARASLAATRLAEWERVLLAPA